MNAEVREEMRLLRKVGWEPIGPGGKHQAIQHPEFGQFSLPCTPSDHRWRKNQRRDIARRMGLTIHQLEIKMGVASQSRTNGHRPKRQRNINGIEVHKLRLAGAFPDVPEEEPNRTPGFCDHDVSYDRECVDCGRAFDDLPKFCEHGRSMQESCRRCCRAAREEPTPSAKAQAPACRYCGETIKQTGKRGHPRTIYCCNEHAELAKREDRPRRVSVLVPPEFHRALGPDPAARVLSLIRDHAMDASRG